MIITIDGPAGTGKTTVAKKVAELLRFTHFDTGAMYRAVTWAILKHQLSLDDEKGISLLLEHFLFSIKDSKQGKSYFVGEQEVTDLIRSQEVTAQVSSVSALSVVRRAIWDIQRRCAEQCDAVFEGRDLGTVVFPHADLKIFLTSRAEVRAQRRLNELVEKKWILAVEGDLDKVTAEIMLRDQMDSTRALAPLKCPEDAYVIDTSELSIDEVVALILQYKNAKMRLS